MKEHWTNLLLAVLIVLVAGIFIRVLLQPTDDNMALRGYQERRVTLAAGDPLPITQTTDLRVTLDGEPITGTVVITSPEDIPTTLGTNVVLVDVTGQGDVPITLDSETVAVSDIATGTITVDIDAVHLDEILPDTLKVISSDHVEVHEGEMYHASFTTDLTDDSGMFIWFTTGADTAHFKMSAAGGGEVSVSMWETPTLTAGTLITPVNMKRDSALVSTVVISHTPTVTSTGTAMFEALLVPGGSGPGNSTTGGSARSDVEWILAASRSHLIQLWNTSGGTISTTWQANWYEE